MSDDVPRVVHEDGLAAALYRAYADAVVPIPDAVDGPPTWAEVEDDGTTGAIFRSMAARLQADGVLTLLEVPEGHDPLPAAVTPAVVGHQAVNLRHAVQVLAISVGFLRGDDGQLALCGAFTGTQRDEPDQEVAAAWIMSREAVAGLLVQIVDAAGAVDPALALSLATAAIAAGQRQVDGQSGLSCR